MESSFPTSVPYESARPTPPWYHWRRLGFNFLTLSLLAHLFLGVGAAYLVVQTISQRKQTFAGGPTGPTAATHALEHQVQMQKKQATMSAPAAVKRITTVSNAKVSLPAMPPVFNAEAQVLPLSMAGMGGAGLGPGFGAGGSGGGNGKGTGMTIFGARNGKGLKGTLYDLKQTSSKGPTQIHDVESFVHELNQFLMGGWNEGLLNKYFKAPMTLTATQIFVPHIASTEAPKAFGVEGIVKPSLWMALYKGRISPPENGVYHFVGGGDNILIVRINGKIILDRSWYYQERYGIDRTWKSVADYDYHFGGVPHGFAKGQGVEMSASEFYDMQILLGDDGGAAHFSLLVEKEGTQYQKTAEGLPILPLFRTSKDAPPPGEHPPFQPDGPVWKVRDATTSAL